MILYYITYWPEPYVSKKDVRGGKGVTFSPYFWDWEQKFIICGPKLLLFTSQCILCYDFVKCIRNGDAFAWLHYVAVHKAPKYGVKVPTNANTPYRISFVEIIG